MGVGHEAHAAQTPVLEKQKSPKTKAQIAMMIWVGSVESIDGRAVLGKKQNQGSVPGGPRHAIFSGGMSTRKQGSGLGCSMSGSDGWSDDVFVRYSIDCIVLRMESNQHRGVVCTRTSHRFHGQHDDGQRATAVAGGDWARHQQEHGDVKRTCDGRDTDPQMG